MSSVVPENQDAPGVPERNALQGVRVLVTGGLGFVGSNLVHACLDAGAIVTVLDNATPGSGANPANLAGREGSVTIRRDDIRDAVAVCEAVAGQDVVFHAAAYTSHPLSMQDPFTDVEVNCRGTLNLLEALRRFNPGAKLVHVGTSTQTGPARRDRVDEDHPEFPADIYSANKTAAEKYVLIYGRAYGLRVAVVRLSNTYGPRACIGNPDLGFLNYFVGLALRGETLRVFGDGSQRRTVVYVDDAVDALLRAALSPRTDPAVWFAAGDEPLTVAEIARALVETIGGALAFAPWPAGRRAIEIGDAVIDNRRIRAELGATFSVRLAEGLARTRDFYRPRLKDYL